ncbi:DUF2239 family protein [Maritalea porphyrae]|uniref:DUF2239 family protein n=1 Tax=Maritalea porphyrae TaxID=880732 RepID=UPI0022AFEF6E|nr:DUF2239 family protein [Maritalea porphyrae]MCZ4272823.1 DUF2239 family protein [Maritalea porphyrae]
MTYSPDLECVAFVGHELIASGTLAEVVHEVKRHHDQNPNDMILVFDNQKSNVIELDLRGSMEDVFGRMASKQPLEEAVAPPKRPGRPKLGVVSKEVTLLPRHWEWLREQRGGASVTLRKLVGEAMHVADGDKDKRAGQQTAYKLMTAVAGDLPNYEEAIRALFAGDAEQFFAQIADWPTGLKNHLAQISRDVFLPPAGA